MKLKAPRTFILLIPIALCAGCNRGSDKKGDELENERTEREEQSSKGRHREPLSELDLDSIKRRYGERFNELRTIVNRHDPIALLDVGAPQDEYEPEVKTLIVQLDSKMTKEEVHDLVYKEFRRWFGGESVTGPKERYRELSEEIHDWLQKKKGRQ